MPSLGGPILLSLMDLYVHYVNEPLLKRLRLPLSSVRMCVRHRKSIVLADMWQNVAAIVAADGDERPPEWDDWWPQSRRPHRPFRRDCVGPSISSSAERDAAGLGVPLVLMWTTWRQWGGTRWYLRSAHRRSTHEPV